MALDLELLAVSRAQEQMEGDGWKQRDPDEPVSVPEVYRCLVCGTDLVRRARGPRAKVCPACTAKGWRPAPCVSCGGPTQTKDRNNQLRRYNLYGCCSKCRAEMRRNKTDRTEVP